MSRAVGIDFGTTRTIVAALENGRPVTLMTAEGGYSIPSVVAVSEEECLVGTAAKRRLVLRPHETVCAVKRFLGKSFTAAARDIARVPYVVERGANDTIKIRIQGQLYAPEELVALLLRQALDEASRTLGEPVRDVVLSVPATFTAPQRQAVCDAAAIAGLHPLQLVHEPTAAALAYGVLKKRSATVLVVDIGSGASEVALVEVDRGACEVRASGGDPHLGGDDFDQCLADHVIELVKQRHAIDIRTDPYVWQRVYEAVEQAKCELSSVSQTDLYLPHLLPRVGQPGGIHVPISRAQFEALVAPLVRRCTRLIEQILADAGMSASDIDDVVLIGGASRIPAVRAMVKQLTREKEPVRDLNPDTAVAAGAALLAGILGGQAEHMLVFDVMPLALSMAAPHGQRRVVVGRNTPLPCRATALISATAENQTATDFLLFQDGWEADEDVPAIGRVTIEGIRPVPQGVSHVEVIFDLDVNGLLTVRATDRDTGAPYPVSLVRPGNLDPEEVERLKRVTEQRTAAERQRREAVRLRNAIDFLTEQMARHLETCGDKVARHERLRCAYLIDEARRAVRAQATREVLLRVQGDLQQSLYGLFAVAAYEERGGSEMAQVDPPVGTEDREA
jgi:molecular chaperone DnaK